MTLGLVFWIVMLLWVLLSGWWYRAGTVPAGPAGAPPWLPNVVLFILFLLLGWAAFGPPIVGR